MTGKQLQELVSTPLEGAIDKMQAVRAVLIDARDKCQYEHFRLLLDSLTSVELAMDLELVQMRVGQAVAVLENEIGESGAPEPHSCKYCGK